MRMAEMCVIIILITIYCSMDGKRTMNVKIFDSHAHYDHRRFNGRREKLLGSLPGQGVGWVVNCGTGMNSSGSSMLLAERFDYIWFAAGLHPCRAVEWNMDGEDTESRLRELLAHPRCVAVGETGLDYHRFFSPREIQLGVFREQLRIAADTGKPVVLHCREAYDEMLEVLRDFAPLRGVVHCWSGDRGQMERAVEMGLHIAFGGGVTYEGSEPSLEAAAAVPMERIMLETDCPYLAPEPMRGQGACDSTMIPLTAGVIGEKRGIDPEEIIRCAAENACSLFGVSGQ